MLSDENNQYPCGWYLIGLSTGTIEPFFVRIFIDEDGERAVYHHQCEHIMEMAVDGAMTDGSPWVWRRMEIGRCPTDEEMQRIPDQFIEPGAPWRG